MTPSLCGSKQLQAQQQLSKKQHDKQPVILPSDFEKEGALLQMRMEGGRDSAGRLLPWVRGKGRPLPPTPAYARRLDFCPHELWKVEAS